LKFFPTPTLEDRPKADLLVLPFWEEGREAADYSSLKKQFTHFLKSGDFKAKQGETALLYPEGGREDRILLLGLGKEQQATPETIRCALAAAVSSARARQVRRVNFFFPNVKKIEREVLVRSFFEGIFLANYAFLELKGDSLKENPVILLEEVGLIGLSRKDLPFLEKLGVICSTVFWVRDWVNRNADDKTPVLLAKQVESLAKQSKKLKVKIFDREQLEKEKMGLLLAVNRGSSHEPRLIQLSYRGHPSSKEHIVLVGKGVTFDTGGLSLKPSKGMLTMKCDMSGAAIVVGTVQAAALLGLKVNVTAVAPVTENCIDAKSYKLGDVYRAHNGKMVEISDTDAEGRLILADALSYAAIHLKPTYMIDIATLTGSVIVALGEEISGLYSSDERLAAQLLEASLRTSEHLWRLPLFPDYRESIKSEIADLVNTAGRDGGSIKAALFLQEFVHGVPWAHIDAAGPCYLSKPQHYHPTKATGYGIRLLIEFLEARV
jgi:leucyl aminopeptidase